MQAMHTMRGIIFKGTYIHIHGNKRSFPEGHQTLIHSLWVTLLKQSRVHLLIRNRRCVGSQSVRPPAAGTDIVYTWGWATDQQRVYCYFSQFSKFIEETRTEKERWSLRVEVPRWSVEEEDAVEGYVSSDAIILEQQGTWCASSKSSNLRRRKINNDTPTSYVTTINELPVKFPWNLTGKNMEPRKETIMSGRILWRRNGTK